MHGPPFSIECRQNVPTVATTINNFFFSKYMWLLSKTYTKLSLKFLTCLEIRYKHVNGTRNISILSQGNENPLQRQSVQILYSKYWIIFLRKSQFFHYYQTTNTGTLWEL